MFYSFSSYVFFIACFSKKKYAKRFKFTIFTTLLHVKNSVRMLWSDVRGLVNLPRVEMVLAGSVDSRYPFQPPPVDRHLFSPC